MRRLIALLALTGALIAGGVNTLAAQTPNPAQTLVGQRATSCKLDTLFSFTVVSADWTGTVVDRPASPSARWALVVADVTNLGTSTDYIQGRAKLRDDRDREFSWRLFNGADIYVEDDIATRYGVTASWEGFDPGITKRTVLIFEVAGDARVLTLMPDNLACDPATEARTSFSGPVTAGPPPPPTPARTLVGQQVTACKADTRFTFSVVDADWTSTIIDRTARAGAMWAVVVADVTNLGPATDYIQGRAKVRDDRGREFTWRLFNGLDLYVETDLATQYGLKPSWEAFDPGITERTVLIFEVAADAQRLTLLPDNLACQG